MADEATKVVGLDFVIGDKGVRELEQVKGHTEKLKEHAHGAERAFDGMKDHVRELRSQLVEMAAGIGLGLGFKAMAEGILDANREMEEMQRRLGSLSSAYYDFGKNLNPAQNMAAGLESAKRRLEDFQQTSMRTGIATKSYEGITSALMPAFAQGGKGIDDVVRATEKLAVVATKTGQDPQEFAYKIAMAIETGQARGLRGYGIGGKAFASESPEKRVATVEKALAKFNVTGQEGATTFGGLLGVVKSQIEYIEEVGGRPLFLEAKREVMDIGAWLKDNRETIIATAKEVAGDMRTGFQFIRDHMQDIKLASEGIAAIWVGGKLLKGVSAVGGAIGTMSKALGWLGGLGGGAAATSEGAAIGTSVGAAAGASFLGAIAAPLAAAGFGLFGMVDANASAGKNELIDRARAIKNKQAEYDLNHGKSGTQAGVDRSFLSSVIRGASDRIEKETESSFIEKAKKQPPTTINGGVHLHMNFDKEHDPDEIAFSVQEMWRKLSERPRQAIHAGQHSTGM
jgi:hypothetical protein